MNMDYLMDKEWNDRKDEIDPYESIIKPMSKKRILETLRELKNEVKYKPKSKYFFALGYAIRCIEENYVE